jgi:hypothetical protein
MHGRCRPLLAALLTSALTLAACSSSEGDDDDDGARPDAAAGPADAMPFPDANLSFDCPDGNFGELGEVLNPMAFREPLDPADPEGAESRILFGELGENQLLSLILADGRGAFDGGPALPGTYELGGDEAAIATCGICLVLCVTTDEAEFQFIPVSGTATLQAVDTELTGSAEGLELRQLDPNSGEVIENGGCSGTATSVSFSAPFTPA